MSNVIVDREDSSQKIKEHQRWLNNWNNKLYGDHGGEVQNFDEILDKKWGIKSAPLHDACWSHIPLYWEEDVEQMIEEILKVDPDPSHFKQIKESYCRLVVYHDAEWDSPEEQKVNEIIDECIERLRLKGVHP